MAVFTSTSGKPPAIQLNGGSEGLNGCINVMPDRWSELLRWFSAGREIFRALEQKDLSKKAIVAQTTQVEIVNLLSVRALCLISEFAGRWPAELELPSYSQDYWLDRLDSYKRAAAALNG